ncbi:MAG: flagellar motor switch phosphatase FliY [Spirochaetes bacterium]|nr:flagellar motor switch phosphatase FliY [Spirochaetota bacterium]
MSDGSLTQDEIDALLQGSASFDLGAKGPSPSAAVGITPAQRSQFEGLLQKTIGSQASNLSMLVTKTANYGPIKVDVLQREKLLQALEDQVVQISMPFSEGLSGEHLYILPESLAVTIAGLMMGQQGIELNEAALSALQEAIGQISGPVLTALGDSLRSTVLTEPPTATRIPKDALSISSNTLVIVTYPIMIEGEMPADMLEVFTPEQVITILSKATTASPSVSPKTSPTMGQSAGFAQPSMGPSMGGFQGAPVSGVAAPFPGMPFGSTPPMTPPNVQPVQFPSLQPGPPPAEHGNISLLMDVYMEMTVELGRTKKLIKEILGMGEGTIIELDKLAGEPVDILVNHKLIAKGEVVVIDENFGVRVTEIVSPMERMKDLT